MNIVDQAVVRKTLLSVALFAFFAGPLCAAEGVDTKGALEEDPKGWIDILPTPDLEGWSRVPVPPGGELGRAQWRVDTDKKLLICDGDGGHDMLLTEQEYGDAIFHFEYCYTKVEGVSGYNSGAYVRNSKDGAANQALIREGQCRGFRIRRRAVWMRVSIL